MLAGGLMGAVVGLIPLTVAVFRRQTWLAACTAVLCVAAGLVGGLLLAGPLALILTVVALVRTSQGTDRTSRTPSWMVGVPIAIVFAFIPLGILAVTMPAGMRLPKGLVGSAVFTALVASTYVTSLVMRFTDREVDDVEVSEIKDRIAALGSLADDSQTEEE